jgi:N-acetylglutamate synthase-like GNAT family acetyltransferase
MIFSCGIIGRKSRIVQLIKNYGKNINISFCEEICEDKRNKIICHCVSSQFDFAKVTSILVYRRIAKERYAIFIVVVNPCVRTSGYGSLILNEFIGDRKYLKSLVLHALPESILFYKSIGFKKIKINNFLEKYESDEHEFVGSFMEFTVYHDKK